MVNKSLRTCSNGHQYYKSSDCPVCPICEKERKPDAKFLSELAAPARRAFERDGITSIEKLSKYTKKGLLKPHVMGPSSIPKLENLLHKAGLEFSSI